MQKDRLFRARAAAGVVDYLVAAVVTLASMLTISATVSPMTAFIAFQLLLLLNPLIFAWMISRYGATPGKRLFWLRIADETGKNPGFRRALIRVLLKPHFVMLVCFLLWSGLCYLTGLVALRNDMFGRHKPFVAPLGLAGYSIFAAICLWYAFGSFIPWRGQAYWDRITDLYVHDVGEESIAAR